VTSIPNDRLLDCLATGTRDPALLLEYARRVAARRRGLRCREGHDACALVPGGPCAAKAALEAGLDWT
jgi:hypothetical protein